MNVLQPLPVDHLVVLARELDRAVDDLELRLGVRAAIGGRHHAFGTYNALLSLGDDCYLELIAVDPLADPAQITRHWPFIPRNLVDSRSWPSNLFGDGRDRDDASRLVNFAVRSHDITRDAELARSRGFDPGEIISMSRDKPDGTRLSWELTLRSELAFDGLVPFLIDWGQTPHPSRSCPQGCTLIELRGEHPDPTAVKRGLSALGVELDVRWSPRLALVAVLDSPRGPVELR